MEENHKMTNSDRMMLHIIKRNFETIMPDIKQLQLVILPYITFNGSITFAVSKFDEASTKFDELLEQEASLRFNQPCSVSYISTGGKSF